MLNLLMMEELTATELANTVTSLSTILAGFVPLILERITHTQPKRWIFVYWSIFISGIFTILYHGLGETYFWGRFDVGSNLLIVIALLNAFLGDFYPKRNQFWGTLLIGGTTTIIYTVETILGETYRNMLFVYFGEYGGYSLQEINLVVNAWILVIIVFKNTGKIPILAKRVLYFAISLLFIGFLFSTASNHVVYFYWFSMHAFWHMFHASIFTTIWIGNYIRFNNKLTLNEPETVKPVMIPDS